MVSLLLEGVLFLHNIHCLFWMICTHSLGHWPLAAASLHLLEQPSHLQTGSSCHCLHSCGRQLWLLAASIHLAGHGVLTIGGGLVSPQHFGFRFWITGLETFLGFLWDLTQTSFGTSMHLSTSFNAGTSFVTCLQFLCGSREQVSLGLSVTTVCVFWIHSSSPSLNPHPEGPHSVTGTFTHLVIGLNLVVLALLSSSPGYIRERDIVNNSFIMKSSTEISYK